MLKMFYEHIFMPQSWPSQWVLLFVIFIFSFVLVIILTFFLRIQSVNTNKTSIYSSSQLIWSW